MLAQQAADVELIGLAETQQMLSQRMSKAALVVQFTPDPEERQRHLAELQSTTHEWRECRQMLQQSGESLKLSGDRRVEAERMFAELEPASKQMWRAANELIAIVSAPVASATPEAPAGSVRLRREREPAVPNLIRGITTRADRPRTAPLVRQILVAEQTFTTGMSQMIQEYNQKAAAGVVSLRRLELGLLAVTLGVLVLEGLLIFRPAVRKIRQAVAALEVSLKETQATARQLAAEQERSERLLLNILPEAIATRLKQEQGAIADGFAEATVLFADIVGFTQLSTRLAPQELVILLNQIFSRFDQLVEKHQLEKIKTIGDAYMVVGGLPDPRPDHTAAIADMALDMQREIAQFNLDTGETFSMRIGINSGPVIAGVIGIKKFIYDLWGDTVNTASRMESHGIAGQIQVTEATYQQLKKDYLFEPRGKISVKGKGEMETYLLKGKRAEGKG
jgi:class 3 adenylate cyclase